MTDGEDEGTRERCNGIKRNESPPMNHSPRLSLNFVLLQVLRLFLSAALTCVPGGVSWTRGEDGILTRK